jgi:hypothetical protein
VPRGFGAGSVTIFGADHGSLDRRIAARTIKALVAQDVEPDCGDGYYRA